jgi:hypothetical protein
MVDPREMNDTPRTAKPDTSPFDVVMLKIGVSEQTCKPEDIKRIRVMATDQMNAIWDPKVVAEEKEYRWVHTTPPGHETELEMSARSRLYNGGATDPKKIGFEDPIPMMPGYDKK